MIRKLQFHLHGSWILSVAFMLFIAAGTFAQSGQPAAQKEVKRSAETSGLSPRSTQSPSVFRAAPAPRLLNETVLLSEGFDSGTLPAGWDVQIDGVSSPQEIGNCESAIFSFNCTSDPFFGGLSPEFSGNFAIIDDDSAGFGEESIKAIITPEVDLSGHSGSKALSFAWTFTYISSSGADYMNVEAWNGSSWDILFTMCCDDTNGFENIDISSYSNSDFKVRFLLDDGGGWVYGFGIDTVKIAVESGGGDPSAYCIPEGTNSTRFINNFSTTGGTENISNLGSGYSPGGYGDFYDTHQASQVIGSDVEVSAAISGGTAGFRIWVDWNQDGVFDVEEEVAYHSTGYSTNHSGSFTVPPHALPGETRMRIVSHWLSTSGDIDPCATFEYGEFEDYKFNVIPLEDCSGTPDAGIVSVDPDSGNPGSEYEVSASDYTVGSGLTYQWQSNTDGAGWVNEGDSTEFYAAYTATAPSQDGAEVEWRLEVTCTLSNETAVSTTAVFTVEKEYCIPEGTNASRYIDNFSTSGAIENISNLGSGFSDGGYGDFYDTHSVVQNPGDDVEFEADIEGGTAGFRIWVDWNQNGTFEADEVAYASSSYASSHSGSFTIPADAPEGETRMRIVSHWLSSSGDVNPCITGFTYGEFEDYKFVVGEGSEPGEDCGQGDDSNDFENGFQIGTGTDFENADDFIVSGGTLSIKSIELNVLANAPVESINLTFYEDDNNAPGTVATTVTNADIYGQVQIGSAFGYNAYTVYINVEDESLDFTQGRYWMQPVAQAAGGGTGGVFWEVTTAGTLGEPVHTRELGGAWLPDEDDSQAVFKLHCEVVDVPPQPCLFDITSSVEPITRVVMSNVDNTSSPTSTEALEDFTDIEIDVAAGESYEVALEGFTGGNWTNYFTVFIDQSDGNWSNYLTYEIGSITNSTGTDGQQAIATIEIPAEMEEGSYLLRVVKNFSTSPLDPCNTYGFGQGEDYTLVVGEGSEPGVDCGQGDDSNDFENGFQIGTGTDFENADDFIVSGGTLSIKSIELNVLANAPLESINLTFYEDDNNAPGTVATTVTNADIYGQVQIGSAFGYNAYTVYINVEDESLDFTQGRYWMQPVAQAAGGGTGGVFWEVTTAGTLGEPVHTRELGGAWLPDEDDSQAVFKLHCEVVDVPPQACLFDITSSVEPITRVVMSNVDNTSSPTSTEALEDFTDIHIMVESGGIYEVALEGNTSGNFTNYFTVFIDRGDGDWEDFDMFEIGSITNSSGTDGQQATADITIPADLENGNYLLRVVKNYNVSPVDPCGSYSFGQGEDYTLVVGELEDCTGTPDPGTVSVNPSLGTPGTTYNVSASGVSFGGGMLYQWQSNTDGAGWVNEGDATSQYSSFTATVPQVEEGTEIDWRLEVTCTHSNETAVSNVATFTVVEYCIPEGTNSGRYIDNFSTTEAVDNISNLGSGFSPGGYGNFYDTHEARQNREESISFSADFEGGTFGFRIWVDWNQDGVFDPSEVVYSSSSYQSSHSGSFTIPANAELGETRMRIVNHWLSTSGDVDPCETGFVYGEFEDYKIIVEESVGIHNPDAVTFSFFPNPVKEVLNISSTERLETVQIYNLIGQEVLSAKATEGKVDVSSLPTGVYMTRATFEGNRVETFKIIKD